MSGAGSGYRNLTLETAGGIATLTVSRPEARNALDTATVQEFHQALRVADAGNKKDDGE